VLAYRQRAVAVPAVAMPGAALPIAAAALSIADARLPGGRADLHGANSLPAAELALPVDPGANDDQAGADARAADALSVAVPRALC